MFGVPQAFIEGTERQTGNTLIRALVSILLLWIIQFKISQIFFNHVQIYIYNTAIS